MSVLFALLIAGILVLVAGLGFIVGVRITTTAELGRLGFTADSAKLYKRASRILSRMHTVTELDGDLAADILSPRSRELIGEWLADYRKQIERV